VLNVFVFKNGDLYQIGLSVEAGSVINARSYANLADVARDILEKYQAFTGTGSTEMIRTLSMVDETKYVTVTSGNVNLTVSHMAIPKTISTSSGHIEAVGTDTINVTSFNWVYVFNGAEYNHVYVSFENGVFHTFWDDRAINKIGDTDVNITKEQAIDIAMKYIENYSYASGGVQVSGFNVTKDRTVANLLTTVRDGDMLYPFWSVFLYLNQTYPSGVNSLLVKVWADSGEVFECSKETGGSQTVNDSNPESTPTPQPQDSASPTATPSLPSDNPNSESPSPSPEVQSSGNPDSASTPTPETNAPSPAVDNPALSAGTQSPDMLLIGIGIATAIAVATAATVIVVFVKRRRK
jgi:hypothetical protein